MKDRLEKVTGVFERQKDLFVCALSVSERAHKKLGMLAVLGRKIAFRVGWKGGRRAGVEGKCFTSTFFFSIVTCMNILAHQKKKNSNEALPLPSIALC